MCIRDRVVLNSEMPRERLRVKCDNLRVKSGRLREDVGDGAGSELRLEVQRAWVCFSTNQQPNIGPVSFSATELQPEHGPPRREIWIRGCHPEAQRFLVLELNQHQFAQCAWAIGLVFPGFSLEHTCQNWPLLPPTGFEMNFELNSKLRGSEPAPWPVSYTHLRAHETPEHLVCRLLLEKKKKNQ
eukprot:TRINITY_DN14178_c0_g1_i4.p2 TRINITY_DN14178_c0_g1~~TRINITY_DN14178_c0_g1_i4.p2  ORF type:complete len:185 (-),score=59.26 TRINITY_DN14178_c0_g1_i4:111-665(-)